MQNFTVQYLRGFVVVGHDDESLPPDRREFKLIPRQIRRDDN